LQFGASYTIEILMDVNTLQGIPVNTTIIECPSGYGIDLTANILQCYICPENTFKLAQGLYTCIK